MPAWVGMGYQDYARRMPREMPLQLVEIRPEPRGSGGVSPAQIERLLKLEAERVRRALPSDAIAVALDEQGKSMRTEELAKLLQGWQREARDTAFLIGGPDGLDVQLKQSARLMLSLSAMTLPHQLVRVLLAEQLYRAATLLQGHPYHRP